MMKLRYSPSEKITFETDAATPKAAFEALAELQEVFEGHDECGLCHSKAVRFDVREFSGNSYYKMFCTSCRATLDFGQHREGGGLFPKVFEKETREPLPNGGWYIYHKDGDDQQREADQRQSHQRQRTSDAAEVPTVRDWLDFFKSDPPLAEFNEFCRRNFDSLPATASRDMQKKIYAHASQAGWVWSNSEGCYVKGRP